ncbi:hypothetical protein SAY87_007177 [Trapa incisa]|uniref:Auxin-responsive protein n=1 Tax=Trapa incisa TaxID=236973 RepID=A0AAN7JY21_9MYRT|nr:hypothetical protein SAY87_007177 [Trapa incisa]
MDLMRDKDIDLEATELRLGLPGTSEKSKRRLVDGSTNGNSKRQRDEDDDRFECSAPPPSKAQIVGWPPVRSNRKNIVQQKRRDHRNGENASGVYVKNVRIFLQETENHERIRSSRPDHFLSIRSCGKEPLTSKISDLASCTMSYLIQLLWQKG